jgi:hypothetical protein
VISVSPSGGQSHRGWRQPDPEGWFTFFPLEHVKCPAQDRRYQDERTATPPAGVGERRLHRPDRRRRDRPCGRAWIVATAGSLWRVRQAAADAITWTTPGGLHDCFKCGARLEVQVLPVVALTRMLTEAEVAALRHILFPVPLALQLPRPRTEQEIHDQERR